VKRSRKEPLRRDRLRTGHRLKTYARTVYNRLAKLYPNAKCELDYESPYQLVVATILSAQCTDKRVNMVTPSLFARYPGPRELASASALELEGIIKPTGFFRAKSRSLIGMAQSIEEHFDGKVPDEMDKLVELPGVGRKTANVVLGNAFGKNEGVVVDTHVTRLSLRLGFTRHEDPVKIEEDLMPLFPKRNWAMLSHLLISHGRQICVARTPRCESCPLNEICPASRV
jgi:endonuclease-3